MTDTMTLPDFVEEITPSLAPPADSKFEELTLAHRCDACSAAAVAQVEVSEDLPHLLLCGHHYRKNMLTFKEKGYALKVPDEYDYLFTDREIAARPRDYTPRDAGSAPA